ncbi:uncharacterized protein LOC142985191 isoform X3 [Anticarsia gemmatalis]|uniref:uncharacterized protein LOC142985191 isoform X3 n=1 Tax=Anticarsia gemmatalis TaxID=129554 RepID=UPI003F763725
MDFEQIVVKEGPGLCRCCLTEGCYKDLGKEYTWMNETEVYADMLLECFDISITQHNEGPNGPNRLICEVCITRLRDACYFKKQVQDSEKKFIDMMGRGEFRSKNAGATDTVVIFQQQMKTEAASDVPANVVDAEVEFLDEEIGFADDAEDDDTIEDPEPSVSDITVSSLPIKGKRGRPKKTTAKTDKKAKIAKLDDKPKAVKSIGKGPHREAPKRSANFYRRENLVTLFNHTTLVPFKWRGKYLCFYCGLDFDCYKRLIKHTQRHGLCSDEDRAIKLVKSADTEIKLDVSYIGCRICSYSFTNLDDIINHLMIKHDIHYNKNAKLMLTTYKLADLECMVCDKKFDYFAKLVIHMNSSHPSECFSCGECKQIFNKKRDLCTHVRNYHRQSYPCVRCGESFETNVVLQHHRLHAHQSTCNICLQTFSSDLKRLKHMKDDHTSDEVQCGVCHQILSTKQAVLRHAPKCTIKKESLETIVVDDEDKKIATKDLRTSIATIINMSTAMPFKFFMSKFRCFYCTRDFTHCDGLKEHTIMEHPQCEVGDKSMKMRNRYDGVKIKIDTSNLSCKLCLETVDDLNSLVQHLTTEHKIQCNITIEDHLQPFKLIKNNYPCPLCDEVYRYFGLLLKHVSKSHTGNKYICVFCGQSFRTDPNLRAHTIRYHSVSNNKFECNQCDMIFPTYVNLKSHLGKDHGIKMFKCLECNEKFTTQYWMQRHMLLSHGGGHKCSYCDKAFIKYSFMVNHIRRVHLKEKNVKCRICTESFFDRQRLKMHMIKHVGERNFHCDICNKKFLWKRNLRAHIASHVRNANQAGIT